MSDITEEDVMKYCYSRNLMLVTKESLEYMHRPIVIKTMNKNAIPVEWIEKKIEKLDKEAKEYDIFIREELAGYGDNVIWQKKRALVELVESWKKEKKE